MDFLVVTFCRIVSLCSRLAVLVGCQNQCTLITNNCKFIFDRNSALVSWRYRNSKCPQRVETLLKIQAVQWAAGSDSAVGYMSHFPVCWSFSQNSERHKEVTLTDKCRRPSGLSTLTSSQPSKDFCLV